MNLAVYDVTASTPIHVISIQEIQSKFKKICHPYFNTKIIVRDERRSNQLRYHETTASWNFFILRMAMIPPELRSGLRASKK